MTSLSTMATPGRVEQAGERAVGRLDAVPSPPGDGM
jgi:hypothetical protein